MCHVNGCGEVSGYIPDCRDCGTALITLVKQHILSTLQTRPEMPTCSTTNEQDRKFLQGKCTDADHSFTPHHQQIKSQPKSPRCLTTSAMVYQLRGTPWGVSTAQRCAASGGLQSLALPPGAPPSHLQPPPLAPHHRLCQPQCL